jgi:CheY-like chemotaxis protein
MRKILLVSTSKVFLRRNANLLFGRGLEIFTAYNGEEALKLHEEHIFDLILSELELDGIDGSRLCAEVHMLKNSQHVSIILICYDILNSIHRVEQSGANAMLLKPIDPIQLLETIGSFIDMQLGRSKRVVLNVKVISKQLDQEFLCFSHDVSNTGILLETEHQLSLGNRIICKFTLDDSFNIEAEGEVIRYMSLPECRNLYGVKFLALPLPCRKAIEDYVAARYTPKG